MISGSLALQGCKKNSRNIYFVVGNRRWGCYIQCFIGGGRWKTGDFFLIDSFFLNTFLVLLRVCVCVSVCACKYM